VLSSLSIRWRLTIFHTIVILIVGWFLLAVLGIVTVRAVQTGVEETVERRASQVTRLLETGTQPDDASLSAFVDDGFLLLIRDADGNVLREIDEDPARYDDLSDEQRGTLSREVVASGAVATENPSELYGYGMPVDTDSSDARVVEVWRSYDEAVNEFIPYLEVVTFVIPGLFIFAIAGSWLMARSAMAPVSAIVRQARQIGEDDLSQRLPVERPRDEIGQLAITFNDLLARLDVAFQQREESLRQQRQFVADASHELRTPLTSIEGYARMLRQWGAGDPEATREAAETIEREAGRMRRLVVGMLDLAHGDVGVELATGRHDLRETVNDAVGAARMAARGRVGVFAEVPSEPVVAEVDRERIYQVLGALLDNAVKYTPEGGSVTVSVARSGDAVELAVRDTGVGIDARHLPHIFDRFYRADEARSAGGSGLGLAIAKQIVERHGGGIAVASEPGQGTTFTVTLPVAGPPVS
jgi:two-component system, OmpR family, sensor kinase